MKVLSDSSTVSREIDFDMIFMVALPGIVGFLAIWLNHEGFMLALQLMFAILFYEILLFSDRRIYGLNGLRVLSFPSLMFFSYTLLIAIPAVYVVTVKDVSMRWDFWIAVLLFYILMPLGYVIAAAFWPIDREKIPQLYHRGLDRGEYDHKMYEFLVVLLMLCLLIMADYFARVDKVPLFELIFNPKGYMNAWVLREESRKLLEVSFVERYFFAWLIDLFFPLGIAGSAFLAYARPEEKKYRRLFLSFVIIGLFNNSLTTAKAPTAALFLTLLSFFFFKNQKVSLKFVLMSLLLLFAFPFFVIYFISIPEIRQFDNLLINGLLNRIFIVPAEVTYQFFRIFPEFHDFLGGRNSNIYAWLHPMGNFDVANYVAQIWWRDPFTTGLGNAIYLGNFWADFGWTGVVSGTVLWAIFSHYFYHKLLILSDYRKSVIYTSFTVSLVMLFSFAYISGSWTVFFLSKGLFVVIFIMFLLKHLQMKEFRSEKDA